MFVSRRYFALAAILWMLLGCSSEKKEETTNQLTDTIASQSQQDRSLADSLEAQLARSEFFAVNITDYTRAINEGRYEDLQDFFADSIQQYITLKNISPERVAKEASQFFKNKKGIKYEAVVKEMEIKGDTIELPIKMQWENYQAEVLTQVIYNQKGKMLSYKELKVLKSEGDISGKSIKGKYNLSNQELTGTLDIITVSEVDFAYALRISHKSVSCVGNYEGRATFTAKNKTAVTKTENADFIFEFKNNGVQVTEKDASYWHGAQCGFEGFYKK